MNRKYAYKDMDRFRATCRKQNRKYYAKTQGYGWVRWTPEADALVLAHSITDTVLSAQIGHGVAAIQARRVMLRKKAKTMEEKL